MNNIFIVLPAYNEEINIDNVIKDWKNQEEKIFNLGSVIKIVVIDDCSTDSTFKIVEEFSKTEGNVILLKHTKNMGLGAAIKTGINYTLNNCEDGDLMFIMDSDFTHKARFSINMIKKMKKDSSDVVIASRFQNGAEVFGVPKYRLMLSFIAKQYYTLILNVPNVRDYTCGYRLYNTSILKKVKDIYKENYILEMGFTCMVELLYKLYNVGATFSEVPFSLHYDEKGGDSKMKIVKTSINSLFIPFNIKRLVKSN